MSEDDAANLGRSFGDNRDGHLSVGGKMLKFPSEEIE
jgi:hypothetical protein